MFKKRGSSLILLLICVICLIMTLGIYADSDMLMDISFALFIPFALLTGKQSNNRAAAYGYLSLAMILVFLLFFKKIYSIM